MFSHLLVPLDGSAHAESALPLAAKLAKANSARLVLVRVRRTATEYVSWGVLPMSADLIDVEDADCAAYLAQVAASPMLAGVEVETEVLSGMPAPAILDAVAYHEIDLVVMTSHGRTGLARWAFGSVARQVAYHAMVPVLVVREHGFHLADVSGDDQGRPRVLVPLDGSPLAETAIEPALALVTALGPHAALHLALVISPYDESVTGQSIPTLTEQAESYLRGVAAAIALRQPEIAVTHCVCTNFDAAEALIHLAEQGDQTDGLPTIPPADVVVMATHGRSGIAAVVLGSVTERVLHGTKLPLLIAHAPASAKGARSFTTARPTASARQPS